MGWLDSLDLHMDPPEAWITPLTPDPSTTSSLGLELINCSFVTKAEAANWALTESSVFDTKP